MRLLRVAGLVLLLASASASAALAQGRYFAPGQRAVGVVGDIGVGPCRDGRAAALLQVGRLGVGAGLSRTPLGPQLICVAAEGFECTYFEPRRSFALSAAYALVQQGVDGPVTVELTAGAGVRRYAERTREGLRPIVHPSGEAGVVSRRFAERRPIVFFPSLNATLVAAEGFGAAEREARLGWRMG